MIRSKKSHIDTKSSNNSMIFSMFVFGFLGAIWLISLVVAMIYPEEYVFARCLCLASGNISRSQNTLLFLAITCLIFSPAIKQSQKSIFIDIPIHNLLIIWKWVSLAMHSNHRPISENTKKSSPIVSKNLLTKICLVLLIFWAQISSHFENWFFSLHLLVQVTVRSIHW